MLVNPVISVIRRRTSLALPQTRTVRTITRTLAKPPMISAILTTQMSPSRMVTGSSTLSFDPHHPLNTSEPVPCMVLQRLTEAFAQNSAPLSTEIPEWAQEFSDVFSKEPFDSLPERRSWDHAIKLVPDSKPMNCKVYPIPPPRAEGT